MDVWYDYVRNGEFSKLTDRHPTFPQIVLSFACDSYTYDVVELLISKNVPLTYMPIFINKWVENKNCILGMNQVSVESEEILEKKFKMIKFLVNKGLLDEYIVIPKFLNDKWKVFLCGTRPPYTMTTSAESLRDTTVKQNNNCSISLSLGYISFAVAITIAYLNI